MERGGLMSVLGDVLKRPLITEKAVTDKEKFGRYAFEVAHGATKPAIRKAVEDFFKVKVTDVKTLIVRGKVRRVGRYLESGLTGKRLLLLWPKVKKNRHVRSQIRDFYGSQNIQAGHIHSAIQDGDRFLGVDQDKTHKAAPSFFAQVGRAK
jgi:large subunit ribosomal protein L23